MALNWKDLAGPVLNAGGTVLGGLLGNAPGAELGKAIGGALATALGCDPTPDAVNAAIMANPTAVQAVEAKQAQAFSDLQARLADVQDARKTTVSLANIGSNIAWGTPVVSITVVFGFFTILTIFLTKPITMNDVQSAVLNILLGALATAFGQVCNYYLGSSAGSASKDQIIAAKR